MGRSVLSADQRRWLLVVSLSQTSLYLNPKMPYQIPLCCASSDGELVFSPGCCLTRMTFVVFLSAGIISTFLHVHPFGASIEYICSYLQRLDSKVGVRALPRASPGAAFLPRVRSVSVAGKELGPLPGRGLHSNCINCNDLLEEGKGRGGLS